jgi:hypothetical protein
LAAGDLVAADLWLVDTWSLEANESLLTGESLPVTKRYVPFDANQSWLMGSQRSLAILLALVAAGFLAAASLGLWIEGPWWRNIAVAGLASSLVLMILFFHTWFVPIQVVNAALLVGLLWLEWPSKAMVGV